MIPKVSRGIAVVMVVLVVEVVVLSIEVLLSLLFEDGMELPFVGV